MDGVLNVLKPPGMTSFDVAAYLRSILKAGKTGHTGTLDPQAAGVLPVCVGNATKAIEFLTDTDKRYRAEITFGVETDTLDSAGKITAKSGLLPGRTEVEEIIASFEGVQEQVPPMYSAVRMNGIRLYELARKGKIVERHPRSINIYKISVVDYKESGRAIIDVSCSKGTYIRVLCSDIGKKLGCGAYMSFLLRTESNGLKIGDSGTLEEIASDIAAGNLRIIPVQEMLGSYQKISIKDSNDLKKYINGIRIAISPETAVFSTEVSGACLARVYEQNGSFIGIGEILRDGSETSLKGKKLISMGELSDR